MWMDDKTKREKWIKINVCLMHGLRGTEAEMLYRTEFLDIERAEILRPF